MAEQSRGSGSGSRTDQKPDFVIKSGSKSLAISKVLQKYVVPDQFFLWSGYIFSSGVDPDPVFSQESDPD